MGFHKIEEFEAEIKGKKVIRERVIFPSAVAGLVIDLNERMVFVEQYRPCIGENLLEIPAGILDKEGLTPFETLLEELNEECEIANDLFGEYSVPIEPILKYHTITGSSDATTEIYTVYVNTILPNKYEVDDADVESVYTLSLEEVKKYLADGVFKDSKTLLAVTHFIDLMESEL